MLRRYGVVGTGARAQMYIRAMLGEHADVADLVAWCEPNPGRMDHADRLVAELGGFTPSRHAPPDLERMIETEALDSVVITGPDHSHADAIARALRAGADVVVEKPLTTTAEGCREIAEAVAETGRTPVLTFNYRYSPRNSALKRIIADGRVGAVTSVHFEWALDTMHGADYFRRWHRDKANSGGLAIHKASHHFDLLNWWLADIPDRVFADGGLLFYGADNARARGLGARPERGTVDPPSTDPFALDLRSDPMLRSLYHDAERYDGYRRDQDVFGTGITIEDNISALIGYRGGATATYSLNAHSPWEGYRVTVNGTRGRAELEVVERAAVLPGPDGRIVLDAGAEHDDTTGTARAPGTRLLLQRHWEHAEEVPIEMGADSHGGGDELLLDDVFRGAAPDPLGRRSGHRDGTASVAVGLAVNRSMETGAAVRVDELGLPELAPAGEVSCRC